MTEYWHCEDDLLDKNSVYQLHMCLTSADPHGHEHKKMAACFQLVLRTHDT